jgi:hypothetical protein
MCNMSKNEHTARRARRFGEVVLLDHAPPPTPLLPAFDANEP